ncbi:MAG: AAA family ATPase [Anaerolineae bacterium]|jgi:predicted kinase
MNPSLVLISGLPGTDKTKLAYELGKRLKVPVFAKDRFQSQLRLLGLTDREGPAGDNLLFDMADQQLSLGLGAILDAVFSKHEFRQKAHDLAERHSADFKPILCYCSDDTVLKKRMETREQSVPHWSPVGWDAILTIRAYFEPWNEISALHLDAVEDFQRNLSRSLDWILNNDVAQIGGMQ